MSLINKMLQNLEERKDVPESSTSPEPVYEDLRPVKPPRARARGRMGVVFLLLGGVGVGYYAWTQWGDSFFTDSESSTQAPQPPVTVAKPAKPEPVQKQSSAPSVPAPQPKIAAVATQPAGVILGRTAHEAEDAKETIEPAAAPKEPTAANTSLTRTVPGPRPAGALRAPNSAVQDVRMPRAQGRAGAAAPGEIVASVAGDTTPGMEEVESRREQRSRKSGATDVQEAQAPSGEAKPALSRAHGRARATSAKGSGVLEKKVTPLTVEQKAENDYRQAARYLQQGRPGDAEARLRSALAANPRHAKAREVLVGLSLRNGRWREAKQLLEEGIKEVPRYYPFVQLLARIHVEQGADGQALQLMEGAQQAARSDPEYMAFLATLYQRAGRHADAVKAFKHAIGLRPKAGRWWLGLGISLEAEKNWDEAIKAYTRARYSGSLTPKLVRYVERRIAVIKNK